MKTSRAFTLIELLVVVLIIGILAAVALPQYQKAVEKSRSVQALTLLKATQQAVETYRLANGEYPRRFADLDIDIPWTGNTPWALGNLIQDTRSDGDWSIQLAISVRSGGSVLMGRISGKYKGGGFVMNDGAQLWCLERTGNGETFTGSDGDYCEKIMHATRASDLDAKYYRTYVLAY